MDSSAEAFILGLGCLVLFLVAAYCFQRAFGIAGRSTDCPSQESYYFLCPHDNEH